jgi:hypothetical protein
MVYVFQHVYNLNIVKSQIIILFLIYPANGYWCFCDDGNQGLTCTKSNEKVNMCSPNSCLNNGKCYTIEQSIVCACSSNFYGPKCEYSRINSIFTPECNSQLCYNNGVCSLSNNTCKFIKLISYFIKKQTAFDSKLFTI